MSERLRQNSEVLISRTERTPIEVSVMSVTAALADRAVAKGLAVRATDDQTAEYTKRGGLIDEGKVCIAIDASKVADLGLWMKFETAVNANSIEEVEAVQ